MLGSLTALAVGLALIGGQSNALAQVDDFNSGTLSSAWTKYYFNPALVSFTFPTSGSGKALRIQANPIPGAAPAAGAIAQTNVYTDFYVALDLVNWAVNDQAVVLLGQWTPGGADGLSEGTGMILNYDVAQDGETPGDRKGGQLQINSIAPGFSASTKAAADITLEPGRSYRLVLQCVGTTYSGKVYDMNDLTTPLVTINVDDNTYTTGLCGFLSFSRNGTAGVTDVTIDNYYAGTSDPNPAPAPALASPIPGTPIVVTRNPTNRFTNFQPPANGISFKAQTFTSGQINASATKLYLNGVDVSASLAPLPANGSTVNFTTAAGTLAANIVYSGRIELEDTTGILKSTNTFWFDTFSDAYLKASPVKTVEAEDYNYTSGFYEIGTIPVSGLDPSSAQVNGGGIGYFDLVGEPEVDYSKPGGSYHLVLSEYRTADRVQITQGSTLVAGRDEAGDIVDLTTLATDPYRINSTQRSQYVATNVLEYQVRLTSPGDWMNYTRSFTPTNYNVYLRCASFGATTVYLDQVTSSPTVTNQTTARLGTFNVANHIMRLNYQYEQLMDGSEPAVLCLSDTNTLRLTMGGTAIKEERLIAIDYLLFVPTSTGKTVADDFNDGNDTSPTLNWTHVDPIFVASGGLSVPNTYDASTFKYQLKAAAANGALGLGQARTLSLPDCDYTDFYASVDLVDWSLTTVQAFGVLARTSDIGPGTTDGYAFGILSGGGVVSGQNYVRILRIQNEGTKDVPGSGPAGDSKMPIPDLDPAKDYRLVFMGHGTDLEGRLYELPDVTTPIAVVKGNTAGDAIILNSGRCGLLGFGSSTSFGVDVTFDNYYAAVDCPSTLYADNFNDGNDTTPPPAWTHYDPIGGLTAPPATYTFPDGNSYRIIAPQAQAPDAGPARAASTRPDLNFTDFFLSVDVLAWDNTTRQAFGVLARAGDIGLGTTTGYLFSYELGSGTLPDTTGGGTDISYITSEAANGVTYPAGQNRSVHFVPGNKYRLTFAGLGTAFTGRVYDITDSMNPTLLLTTLGTDDKYAAGKVGLLAASQGNLSAHGDATFDNFYADIAEPTLSFDGSSGTAVISWPGNLTCIWVLESSATVGSGAVWTEVPTTTGGINSKVVYDPATHLNTYTAATPMDSTGNTYYRLRKL